ncbi:DNA topology modulation protein FlaR [Paenibacillus glycanilyticus]|nr:DNA topology modulation protein FlaR [Paenibacillus glycanilyticus]
MPRKIHIIGSVGSGKTTFARQLSIEWGIPHYELDNVVWKRSKPADIRRTDEERDQVLRSIIQSDTWIVEGAHYKEWMFPSLNSAEAIVFMDTAYSVRRYRIVRRFILQLLRIEQSHYRPTLTIFRNMFIWNANFERQIKPELLNTLNDYSAKSIRLSTKDEISNYYKEQNNGYTTYNKSYHS